jgi:hypothetical protein
VSGAAAQLNVRLVFDRTEVMVGETVEATLVANFTGAVGSYYSSISANLIASDRTLGLASTMGGLNWGFPALGAVQVGTPDGASLMAIFAAQQSLFGVVDTSNPFVIGQFTIATLAPGELSYTSSRANNAPGSFSFTDAAGGPFAAPTYDPGMASNTLTIRPVPAPASIGLLGLATLMGRRRRGAV